MNLGMDLGTSHVVIYHPEKNTILLDEPAVIAVDSRRGDVLAWGTEAEKMLGRTPPSILAVRPIQKGVIAEYNLAEKLLRCVLHRVCTNRLLKPCVGVSIPAEYTGVEQRSFIEAVISAGARRVTLVPETVAAAIGAQMDVSLPKGQMIVALGAGTVDAAVLTLKGVACTATGRLAGMTIDDAIIRYLRAQYNLIVSELSAERLKIALGGALPRPGATGEIKGRDAMTGLPRCVTVTSQEITDTLEETVSDILDLIGRVLENTPPELVGDIYTDGICLTGGLAQLYGLTDRVSNAIGVPCRVAENPRHCVAMGAGKALQYASAFSKVYDLGDFAYRLSDSVEG